MIQEVFETSVDTKEPYLFPDRPLSKTTVDQLAKEMVDVLSLKIESDSKTDTRSELVEKVVQHFSIMHDVDPPEVKDQSTSTISGEAQLDTGNRRTPAALRMDVKHDELINERGNLLSAWLLQEAGGKLHMSLFG